MRTVFMAAALAGVVGISVYAQAQGTGQGQGAGQGQQAQGAPPQGRGRGGPPQNLQVLPKDWTTQQVQQFMRTFTAGLGVECSHCHVGTPQERAKDDKPEKATARKMIKMMMAINADFLKDVGEPAAAGANKVTCYTCHRGALKPLTAPPQGGGTLTPIAK
jgi:hypothetical protein